MAREMSRARRALAASWGVALVEGAGRWGAAHVPSSALSRAAIQAHCAAEWSASRNTPKLLLPIENQCLCGVLSQTLDTRHQTPLARLAGFLLELAL